MATFGHSAAGGGTSGTSNRAVTVTTFVTGEHVTVFVSLSANTNAAPTCSDDHADGLGAYSLVGTRLWSTSLNNMMVFVRNALLGSTDTSFIITVASGSNTAAEIVPIAYTGMAKVGAGSIRSSGGQANGASGATPTPVLNQSALTGNPTIAAVASGDTTTSPNASWTERQDVSQSTPTTALEVATRDSGFTGTSIACAATQSTVFASFAVELNTDNDGVTSATLGALTTSGTGTVDVNGSTSTTLDAATLTGTGGIEAQGALSVTLEAAVVTGTATSEVAGSLNTALDVATLAATGTVETSSEITGSLDATLEVLAGASTGQVEIGGVVNSGLDSLTVTATAGIEAQGNAAATLAVLTLAGQGANLIAGNAAILLESATLSATGEVVPTITGDLNAVFASLQASSSGTVDVQGFLNSTLGELNSAAGAVAISSYMGRWYHSGL